ncbi:hypothetical protein [Enterococcus avium]|nr:hypothetical protein [Enterococcus avium]MDT2463791.1 hypothetical protein [Enterococcus avium]
MNQDNSENNINTDKDNQTKKTVLKGVRVSEEGSVAKFSKKSILV